MEGGAVGSFESVLAKVDENGSSGFRGEVPS
jgi:hypothetical protein